jgi:hypothetical protein
MKLIFDEKKNTFELFELRNDPQESTNVLYDNLGVSRELKRLAVP